MLFRHCIRCALVLAVASAGSSIAARMAMMAMTHQQFDQGEAKPRRHRLDVVLAVASVWIKKKSVHRKLMSAVNQYNVHVLAEEIFLAGWRLWNGHARRRCKNLQKLCGRRRFARIQRSKLRFSSFKSGSAGAWADAAVWGTADEGRLRNWSLIGGSLVCVLVCRPLEPPESCLYHNRRRGR